MYLSNEQRITTRPYKSLPPHRVETLLEQGSGPINEDVLLQHGNLFGVFDGATSIAGDDLPAGITGGLIAAQITAETFRQEEGDLLHLAAKANRRIGRARCRKVDTWNERYRLWSTSAAVIRLEETSFEYCQTGDSLIFVLRKDGSFTSLTPEIDHDRETLCLWKDTRITDGVKIHDALKEQIRDVRMEMNVTYGVLNGEPQAMEFIRHGSQSLEDIAAILLFTDGLFLPREDPCRDNDWPAFAELYQLSGIKGIFEHIRSLHEQDPDCRKYPRFKMHDDTAAIALSL